MKHEHMDEIPTSLICKRWTKDAKRDIHVLSKEKDNGVDVRCCAMEAFLLVVIGYLIWYVGNIETLPKLANGWFTRVIK